MLSGNFKRWVGAFKFFLSVMLMLLLWNSSTLRVFASPIDDASNYSVRVKTAVQFAFAEDDAGTAHGAGFLYDHTKGWVLTNAHMSGYGTGLLEVAFKGHDFVPAHPVYIDAELDFAVLKINPQNIPVEAKNVSLACGDTPLNGLEVAAFGHPHGLNFSASRGIISTVRFYKGVDWVQTDAAINPGNSGGPLIDVTSGNVVGINAMGLEDTQGLNFAVPIKPICKILELLENGKDPSPPNLPLSFATNENTEEHLIVSLQNHQTVPDGFQLGDRVIEINGEPVFTPTGLKTLLRGGVGDVDVLVERGGEEIELKAKFWPEKLVLSREYLLVDGALIAQDIYPERWQAEKLYHVQSVMEGSYAEQSGWVQYSRILSINGKRPSSLIQMKTLLENEKASTLIFKTWSVQETKLYDFNELVHWPFEVKYVPSIPEN